MDIRSDKEVTRRSLLEILEQAMSVGGARCGNIQVYNPASGALEIVVHRGLPDDVAELWRVVHTAAGTVCARAWRQRGRVSVPELAEDPLFVPYLMTAQRLGLRAVQSTALAGASHPIGVLSTHYSFPYSPNEADAAQLDQCAQRAARALEELAAAA